MYSNYHTHTFRCGHASGTEEEYIKNAIAGGIKIMGFSDHLPFLFENNQQDPWRVPVSQAEDYISTLKELREKYNDKLQLHIGFEMEYLEGYFDSMYDYAKRLGAEYLILGQHYCRYEGFDNRLHASSEDHTEADMVSYTELVIKGIKTGVFSYIAHPDIMRYQTDNAIYKREVTRLCKAAKEYDIPLEINFLGIFEDRWYPNGDFWQIAGEVGNKVIFGFDAHTPERAFDSQSLIKAKEIVKKYDLILVDEINLNRLN